MKWFAFPAALLVFATTAAFADTLPDRVRAEASRLLGQVDAVKAAAPRIPARRRTAARVITRPWIMSAPSWHPNPARPGPSVAALPLCRSGRRR